MSVSANQKQALDNAINGTSTANYEPIIQGFMDKGIPKSEILPRENVFTFNAWIAKRRVVKQGEKGVKIYVKIQCEKKLNPEDKDNDEKVPVLKTKPVTVFHISQTTELH